MLVIALSINWVFKLVGNGTSTIWLMIGYRIYNEHLHSCLHNTIVSNRWNCGCFFAFCIVVNKRQYFIFGPLFSIIIYFDYLFAFLEIDSLYSIFRMISNCLYLPQFGMTNSRFADTLYDLKQITIYNVLNKLNFQNRFMIHVSFVSIEVISILQHNLFYICNHWFHNKLNSQEIL